MFGMSSTKEVLNNYLILRIINYLIFSELNADYIPFENNFDVLTCSFQMLGQCSFNPLHPNISLQVLHTVFYAFLTVLTGRICLTIKSFLSLQSIPSLM